MLSCYIMLSAFILTNNTRKCDDGASNQMVQRLTTTVTMSKCLRAAHACNPSKRLKTVSKSPKHRCIDELAITIWLPNVLIHIHHMILLIKFAAIRTQSTFSPAQGNPQSPLYSGGATRSDARCRVQNCAKPVGSYSLTSALTPAWPGHSLNKWCIICQPDLKISSRCDSKPA